MLCGRTLRGTIVGAVVLAGVAAAAQPDKPARPKSESQIVAEINDQLNSKDPAQHKLAVEAIRARLATRGLSEMRSQWLRVMMTNKQYQEVADLALEGILAAPWESHSLEGVLQMRIKSLLAMGKAEQALSESKSLFNVASMSGTGDVILIVAEAINAARTDDVKMFNLFREEQIAGATPPSTQPTTAPVVRRCTVLDGIKVDAKVYNDALAKLTAEDAQGLMGRGNLLLMADRVKEARVVFERLYSLSSSDLTEASEALARCMKAEDGTIGRANAWIMAIRPKKSGQ